MRREICTYILSALCYRPICGLSMQRNVSLFLKQLTRVERPSQDKIVYISLRAVVSRQEQSVDSVDRTRRVSVITYLLWNALDMNNFYFLFLLFSILRFRIKVQYNVTYKLLLSLTLLSYMVVPIRELANKHFSITSTSSKVLNITNLPSGMDMDINNNNRGRSTFSSRITSRSAFIISNISSCAYHLKMECNNNLLDDMAVDLIDSSQLLYKNNIKSKDNLVSKAADSISTKNLQYVQHDKPTLNKVPKL